MAHRRYPRISLFPLAEYVFAPAGRRWKIVCDHADPPDQVVPLYRLTRNAARAFLRSGAQDRRALDQAIADLETRESSSAWTERDLRYSAAALRHLANVRSVDFGERIVNTKGRGLMSIGGTIVSVNPAVAVYGRSGVGAVALHFGKSRVLREQEAAVAATILRCYVAEKLDVSMDSVPADLCQVVDVWRERSFVAPASYKQRLRRVGESCREIARLWPHVQDEPGAQPEPQPSPLH